MRRQTITDLLVVMCALIGLAVWAAVLYLLWM